MTHINWGIIGCGDVALRKGGPSLNAVEGSHILAVTSRTLEKARRFANKFGVERVYPTPDDLLADPEIDAVYIATPVSTHYPLTIQAAEAGKHILCEKPMGMTVEECERMLMTCHQKGVSLMVAYYRRFFPAVIKSKELIDGGAIGKVLLARVETHSLVQLPSHQPLPWRFQPSLSGGGVLMDIGCHRLDLLIYLLGDITTITGTAASVLLPPPVEDMVSFQAEFSSGAQAIGSFSWATAQRSDILEIVGTEGRILLNPLGGNTLVVETTSGRKEYQTPVLPFTHIGLIENFVEHLRRGMPLACSGEEAIKTNRAIAAIYGK
ncbi:MAG: gfo/Idh/MocA family oxidoreductase [Calditrichaeota bacterium]|nr:MAG: gfo/Idh/MocA family oxidoreductase [Calditrichota bacterium]